MNNNAFIRITRFFLPMAAVVLAQCANLVGGGTEGGNTGRVTGNVIASDGSPLSMVEVRIVPAGFDPVAGFGEAVRADTTGADGSYSFTRLDSGVYSIDARDIESGKRLIIWNIDVAGNSVQVPGDSLRSTGGIRIALSNGLDSSPGYVYVPGTLLFRSFLTLQRSVLLDGVPPGEIPSINYARSVPFSGSRPVSGPVRVNSGAITDILPFWSSSKRVYLNTTPAGADAAGTVVGFPVLVRLTASNFPFDRAQGQGQDLRFAKPDGTLLPYRIERWDSAASKAEVWVLADTVFGNNGTQYLTMFWGNGTASRGDGTVFDTAGGFIGAWHFSPPDTFSDATPDGLDLRDSGSMASSNGIIGGTRVFEGTRTFISRLADRKLDVAYSATMSAWINCADDSTNQKVFSCSNGGSGYILGLSDHKLYGEVWDSSGAGYTLSSPAMILKNQWTHLCVTWTSGGSMSGFINGEPVSAVAAGSAGIMATQNDLVVGRLSFGPPQCLFNGAIDEIRIEKAARSPGWIKLCYMNQRENDLLVSFNR